MPSRTTAAEPTLFRLPDNLSLLAIIREDWANHDRDWTLPGFRAMAVYRLGHWHRAIRFMPFRLIVKRVHLTLYRYVRNHYGIELRYTAILGRRVRIEHQGGIVIHGYCRIGDDCVIRHGVTLGIRSPDRPFHVPVLGNGVDIGAGAKILGDVVLGDRCRIGANAVVLHDVPPSASAVGVPARILSNGRNA
jgi:serine O-acetyltransferase